MPERLLHRSDVLNLDGDSYRLHDHPRQERHTPPRRDQHPTPATVTPPG
ncbi:hypothetical protein [Mobilicoccus sp.]|nr:hypothetical protein [Mobilicoccus sp.]